MNLLNRESEMVRMDQALAGARALQNSFYPAHGLDLPPRRLSGGMRAASECSGGWWDYAVIVDHVIAVASDRASTTFVALQWTGRAPNID